MTIKLPTNIIVELLDMSDADKHDPYHEDRAPFSYDNYGKARALGHRLHKLGGTALMRYVCETYLPRYDWRALENCWNGIGDWHP